MDARSALADAPSRRSAARERLLETASGLFYAEGVQAVGVDRLITAAGVTKATFYRHFPGKDELVLAYIQQRDRDVRARFAAAGAAARDPRGVLDLLVGTLAEEICGPGFRGCPFINTAAEYPDPAHPVRQAVAEHRRWFRAALADLAAGCGHPDPETAAGILVLLRDGSMVAGNLDGGAAREHLRSAVAALVGPAG
ncbi:TetR/AcrR family transcriptional regulator [Kitasatospora paranensis]|uniref:TetR/AcrR family transcriptional regulator n=1 Tax=Kitasatospora paranensis TaxID=258053 RepID=A0ABW2FTK8_9ACTN